MKPGRMTHGPGLETSLRGLRFLQILTLDWYTFLQTELLRIFTVDSDLVTICSAPA